MLSILLVALSSTALAAPTARQVPSGPCAHLGLGGFATASNFTLAALNRTMPNANTTGAPLVLGPAGAQVGGTSEALSTWASYQLNSWPTLSLENGGLIGNPETPSTAKTTSGGASNGSEVTFFTSTLNILAPAPVYCAVANTDPAGHSTGFPALALNGQTDLFSLCTTGKNASSTNNVVYNATASNSGRYVFESCYPVTLQLIGLPK